MIHDLLYMMHDLSFIVPLYQFHPASCTCFNFVLWIALVRCV